MASSVVIPQDIIDSIIEKVGNDNRLLKICSLVSSEFLLPCRKRLFSRISLITNYDQGKSQGLHHFLVKNPVLQSYVKVLSITSNGFTSNSIVSILRLSFCSLECFSIKLSARTSWNGLSTDLKDALSTIIHSSTLKTIRYDGVNIPILLFQGINVTKLELHSPPPGLGDKNPSLLTLPTSGEVGKSASHTVIDQFKWTIDAPVQALPDPIFLPLTCHLRVLDIYVYTYEFNILTFVIRSLLGRPDKRSRGQGLLLVM